MARSADTTFPRITSITTGKELFECAICLQTCIHPARLPCNHIFCYLCIKGIAYISRRCALCRGDIPPEFMENPVLVDNDVNGSSTQNDGYQWYYEGRHGGWWKYDERSSTEIEDAYQNEFDQINLLLCGEIYCIDIKNSKQYKAIFPQHERKIKRANVNEQEIQNFIGIAGIKQK